MIEITLKIDPDAIEKLTRPQLEKNFTKAGIYFTSQTRGKLNTAQPYVRGKTFRGLEPSSPGDYPKKLTGQLQKSITWSFDKPNMVLTVGSNLKGYPSYLQTGTRFMQPRPWLSLSWGAESVKVGQILVGK